MIAFANRLTSSLKSFLHAYPALLFTGAGEPPGPGGFLKAPLKNAGSGVSYTCRICLMTAGSLIFVSSANIRIFVRIFVRISAVFGSSSRKGRKIFPRC